MKNPTRRKLIIGALAIAGAGLAASWPVYRGFGALPKKDFVSPNWHDGVFHNLPNSYVYADLGREKEYKGGWGKFFLSRGDRYPPEAIEAVREDLPSLRDGQFVWLGHSSLLLKLAGKIFCIDPVLSSHASPLPLIIEAWPGTRPYAHQDFPKIDYLCISHDHWDHLDYEALASLSFEKAICGLGVGAHFSYWGIDPLPLELDWHGEFRDGPIRIIHTPSMHFSGRGTTRNRSLWGGFIIDAGSGGKVYFTGDGGFGCHFRDIGQKYGPFEMVFPDTGQYNRAWSRMHMFPEQSAQAVLDAKGRVACPVHIGKFTLSWHPWNEPARRFVKKAEKIDLPYLMPRLGKIYEIGKPC